VKGTAQHFALGGLALAFEFGEFDVEHFQLALVLLGFPNTISVTANAGVRENVIQTFPFLSRLYVRYRP